MLRSQYAQLHETVLQSMEREASVVKKVRQLNQELLQHKIEVEKLGIARVEEAQGLSAQDKEKQKVVGPCRAMDARASDAGMRRWSARWLRRWSATP